MSEWPTSKKWTAYKLLEMPGVSYILWILSSVYCWG